MTELQTLPGERQQRAIDKAVYGGRTDRIRNGDWKPGYRRWKAEYAMGEFAFTEKRDGSLKQFYEFAVTDGAHPFTRKYEILRDNPTTNAHLLDWIDRQLERRDEIRTQNYLTAAVVDGREQTADLLNDDGATKWTAPWKEAYENWVTRHFRHIAKCFCGRNFDRKFGKDMMLVFYKFAVLNRGDRDTAYYAKLKSNGDRLQYIVDWIDRRICRLDEDPEVLLDHPDEQLFTTAKLRGR